MKSDHVGKKMIRRAVTMLLCACIGMTGTLDSAVGQSVGTAVTVDQVLDGVQDSIEQAKNSANEVVANLGLQMQSVLDRVKQDFVNVLDKRVDELGEDMQRELRSLDILIEQSLESMDALPLCLGNEATHAAAALRAGLDESLNRLPLVKRGQPTALLAYEQGSRRPYVLRADQRDNLLVLKGVNFWNEQNVCGFSAKLTPAGKPEKAQSLAILSKSPEEFVLHAVDGIAGGNYILSIGAQPKRRWWQFGDCDEEQTVAVPVQAIPLPKLNVEVTATPYCRQEDVHEYKCSASMVAGSCRSGSESATKVCAFDLPDYKLRSFSLEISENHRGGASATRSGDNVKVDYSAGRKGHRCQHGTGKIAWQLTMIGAKDAQSVLGETVQSNPFDIRVDADASFELPAPATSCEVRGWLVEAKATDARSGDTLLFGPQTFDSEGNFSISNGVALMNLEFPSRKGSMRLQQSSCLDY